MRVIGTTLLGEERREDQTVLTRAAEVVAIEVSLFFMKWFSSTLSGCARSTDVVIYLEGIESPGTFHT